MVGWASIRRWLAGRAADGHPLRGDHETQGRSIVWSAGCGPVRVVVRADRPVRLEFDRRDNHGTTDCVLIPALGILSTLVPFASSAIHLGPCRPGRYEFRSADGRLTGSLVVEPARAAWRDHPHAAWPHRLELGGRTYRAVGAVGAPAPG